MTLHLIKSAVADPPLAEMLDAMISLSALMDEETLALSTKARVDDHANLTATKARLTAIIERTMAQFHRERPDWLNRLDGDEKRALLAIIETLDRAATANREMLDRQLSLTSELMEAVAAEVRRLNGNRAMTYSAAGTMVRRDQPTPIALNSGL